VIGLSAHAMPGSTEKAMEAGCDAYRTKPVQFESLCELIDELMTRARAGDADPIQ
jgi:CheY-like chemotaxis protein